MKYYDKLKQYFKEKQGIKEYTGYFQTRCVFHNEKTPSLTIYENHFYCFGCQKTGSLEYLVSYLKLGKPFKNSRKDLIETPTKTSAEIPTMEYDFSEILQYGNEDLGYKYLLSRYIHSEVAIQKCYFFGKTTPEMKEKFETQFPFLFQDGKFFFEDCYVFPFFQNGKIVYLQGKTLDGKYKNLPKIQKPFYLPNGYILGNKIYVCEGVIDTLSMETLLLWKEDFESTAIGILGVQSWKILLSLPKESEIIIAFDNDIAGMKTTFQIYKVLKQHFKKVEVFEDFLRLDGVKAVKDLNDYLQFLNNKQFLLNNKVKLGG